MLFLDTHGGNVMSADAGLPTHILLQDVDKDAAEVIELLVPPTVQKTSLQLVVLSPDIIICLHVGVHSCLITSSLGVLCPLGFSCMTLQCRSQIGDSGGKRPRWV